MSGDDVLLQLVAIVGAAVADALVTECFCLETEVTMVIKGREQGANSHPDRPQARLHLSPAHKYEPG